MVGSGMHYYRILSTGRGDVGMMIARGNLVVSIGNGDGQQERTKVHEHTVMRQKNADRRLHGWWLS